MKGKTIFLSAIFRLVILSFIILFVFACKSNDPADSTVTLLDRFNSLPGVSAVEIDPYYNFPQAFEIDVTQAVDHNNPNGQKFTQRIFLKHVDESLPMVINTAGKSNKPLNPELINENTPLEFYAADLWELNKTASQPYSEEKPYVKTGTSDQFFFYGNELDKSRTMILKGKKAPSFARPQLRGWGMSEVERLIRSLNQYLKNQDLIFELLDEAKIDVYGIKGFNESLVTSGGTEKLQKRVELANQVKNYQSAIVKDKDDDYEQKQINFSGLSEMLQQIRLGIANDLKMPLTKIFGQSASGFNAGEDDIENYNAMIESEIRGKFDNLLVQMLKLVCQKLFGFIPDDLRIEYKPLRMLSAEQEENVKTSQTNRILSMYDRGLMTSKQVTEEVNQQNLLAIDLEDTSGDDFPTPPPKKPELDLQTNSKPNFINKILNRNGS